MWSELEYDACMYSKVLNKYLVLNKPVHLAPTSNIIEEKIFT